MMARAILSAVIVSIVCATAYVVGMYLVALVNAEWTVHP